MTARIDRATAVGFGVVAVAAVLYWLAARDFVLVEDGRKRPVEMCSTLGTPGSGPGSSVDVALLVDTSDSMLETLRRSEAAATRFLTALPSTPAPT